MFHFVIGKIAPSLQTSKNDEDAISPAAKAGLKVGDKILAINGINTEYYHEFKEQALLNKGKKVNLLLERAGKKDSVTLTISKSGQIGFNAKITDKYLMPVHEVLTLSQSISKGTSRAFGVITDNIKGFGKIFAGKVRADKALSGPIEIAQMYGSEWDWNRFWTLTGLLSMALAFMNLLPIPALDGGHAIFLIYEMIVGKAPSEKFMERAQAVGTFILLGLMVFVIGNGIFKSFK
jgi:regulator of sigma E protease